MNASHFHQICRLIVAADRDGLLIKPRDVSGFSGDKLIGLLQRLGQYQVHLNRGCYLEVGVFQGLSLISTALALGQTEAFGIDNFSQVDNAGVNHQILQKRINVNDVRNATVLNVDYEDGLEGLSQALHGRKLGTYFVDGPHDYRSQLMCLLLARPHLSVSAVVIVDDCNYRHVRLANRDFLITNPEFKLIFEAYTSAHPDNMSVEDENIARQGWWNGVNVIVRDPADVLERVYPPTHRDRTLHLNEHLVHSAKYGVVAPEGVALLSGIRTLSFLRCAKAIAKAAIKFRSCPPDLVGSKPDLNTFSEALPKVRFNPACARLASDESSL